jgi:putrescine transport system ATP-binding protein
MDKGVIRQIGKPTEVYEYPNSRFVAGFIGSINMFEGEITSKRNDEVKVSVDGLGEIVATSGRAVGEKVAVAVRPEKIGIGRAKPKAGANALQGVVKDLGYFGKDSLYRVSLPSGALVSVNSVNARRAGEHERVAQWEDKVWLSFDPSSAIVLTE